MIIRWFGTFVAASLLAGCATPVSSTSSTLADVRVADTYARTSTTHVFDDASTECFPPLPPLGPASAKPRTTFVQPAARPVATMRAVTRPRPPPSTPSPMTAPDPCVGGT